MANVKKALTKKQEAFCQEYAKNGHSQRNAYLVAFDGVPENAGRNASKLMRVPGIIERITELEEEAWKQACITPAKIARELAEQAFSPVDNEKGLTYAVKQNAIKMLQTQMGLDVRKLEAKVEVNNINIDIEDE